MPKGRRSYKKSANKRRNRRKPRAIALYRPVHNFGSKQYAHIQETVEYQNMFSNNMYLMTFCLAEFERAGRLSLSFKWVRPARVTYTYEPMYNVFQGSSSVTTNPGIPYIYTAMNRTQDKALVSETTPANLLIQGAKPKKLAKTLKITYTPNWCSPGLLGTSIDNNNVQNIIQIGSKAEYGWVPTPNAFVGFNASLTQGIRPNINNGSFTNTGSSLDGFGGLGNNVPGIASNAVTYNGHYAFVEQLNRTASACYKVTMTVDWVFKDPKSTLGLSSSNILQEDLSGNVTASEIVV